jgi:hypothetical protein
MPYLFAGAAALVGALGGFIAGDGVAGGSRLVRWLVIGGVVYALIQTGAARRIVKW